VPSLGNLQTIALLAVAALLEAGGDAVLRTALFGHFGLTAFRIVLFVLGAAVLLGFGTFLNLAPLEFRDVVGLYIAVLFIVWQVINFAFFKTLPNSHTFIGGILIVSGGMLVSFWKP